MKTEKRFCPKCGYDTPHLIDSKRVICCYCGRIANQQERYLEIIRKSIVSKKSSETQKNV